MTTATLPPLLTAKQVSEATKENGAEGLSVARVYELAREGHLPCVRLGRSMRFPAAAVADTLRGQ